MLETRGFRTKLARKQSLIIVVVPIKRMHNVFFFDFGQNCMLRDFLKFANPVRNTLLEIGCPVSDDEGKIAVLVVGNGRDASDEPI